MEKMGQVAIVVAITAAAYLILMITMPVVIDLAASANATMTAATANFTDVYPGTGELLVSSPWFLWFVPGSLCIVTVVVLLRRQ